MRNRRRRRRRHSQRRRHPSRRRPRRPPSRRLRLNPRSSRLRPRPCPRRKARPRRPRRTGSGSTPSNTAGSGCPTDRSTRTSPPTRAGIRTSTFTGQPTVGPGWRRRGSGAGARRRTSASTGTTITRGTAATPTAATTTTPEPGTATAGTARMGTRPGVAPTRRGTADTTDADTVAAFTRRRAFPTAIRVAGSAPTAGGAAAFTVAASAAAFTAAGTVEIPAAPARAARRSEAAVPLVALLAPVAAVPLGQERNARQVLGVLVPELDRRVDAGGRAEGGLEHTPVLAVDDQCLRVQRAVEVPALVVSVVERLEIDVARLGQQARPARQLGQLHARPDGDGRPSLDAEMFEAQLGPRQVHQLAEGEPDRALDQPGDLQAPGSSCLLVPDRHLVGDEVGRELRAGGGGPGRRDVHRAMPEQGALDLLVPAFGGGQEPPGAPGPLGVAASERDRRERAAAH